MARVSTATQLATVALSAARDAAEQVRSAGRFDGLGASLAYERIQRLFTSPQDS